MEDEPFCATIVEEIVFKSPFLSRLWTAFSWHVGSKRPATGMHSLGEPRFLQKISGKILNLNLRSVFCLKHAGWMPVFGEDEPRLRAFALCNQFDERNVVKRLEIFRIEKNESVETIARRWLRKGTVQGKETTPTDARGSGA